MGKHQTNGLLGGRVIPVHPGLLRGPRAVQQSPRWTLPIYAFFIAFAIVMVMVVDPYSGEYADAASAPSHWGENQTQQFVAGGDYKIKITHDAFGVQAVPAHAGGNTAPAAGIPSAGSAQAIAKALLTAKGLGDDQYNCLVSLWNRESHWSVTAANPSGAYGIPQAKPGNKMASAGPDWQTNAKTQIVWGLSYIAGRYSTPCGAWAHSQATGWY